MNDKEIELDQEWIELYNNNLNKNINLLRENINSIKFFFIYVENNEIIELKKETFNIENNTLKYLDIINIIKKYNKNNFKLNDILKLELNLNSNDIIKFLEIDKNIITLSKVNIYKDIHFNNPINIFKKIPSMFFILIKNKISNKHLNTQKTTIKSTRRKTKRKNNLKL